jgi:hypothetical protein
MSKLNLNAGIRTAIDKVREWGKDDKEHLIGVSKDGQELFVSHGDKDSVSTEAFEDVIDEHPGMTIVHNHPGYNTLSNGDLRSAVSNRAAVIAATEDGSVYWARSKMPFLLFNVILMMTEKKLMQHLGHSIYQHDSDDPKVLHEGHWINLLLRATGAIEYEYEQTEFARQLYSNKLAGIRDAETVEYLLEQDPSLKHQGD